MVTINNSTKIVALCWKCWFGAVWAQRKKLAHQTGQSLHMGKASIDKEVLWCSRYEITWVHGKCSVCQRNQSVPKVHSSGIQSNRKNMSGTGEPHRFWQRVHKRLSHSFLTRRLPSACLQRNWALEKLHITMQVQQSQPLIQHSAHL